MTDKPKPKKRKLETIYLRVEQGALVPADGYARNQLRAKGYRTGDVLSAVLKKLRSAGFNRLVHRIGQLVVKNIDAFAGIDAHTAIKRLQIEGKVACDEIGILIQGYGMNGMMVQFIPRSLSFESMDEGEYREAARGICRTIAERYWKELTPEQIEEMAESFVEET